MEFDPEKSYFLVGCLGGLGRSLSQYMIANGARHFTFLGRSGADKPLAKGLVLDLEKAGAKVQVVRGDAANFEVVRKAIADLPSPLGGIVQATMALAVSSDTQVLADTEADHKIGFSVHRHEQQTVAYSAPRQNRWNVEYSQRHCRLRRKS